MRRGAVLRRWGLRACGFSTVSRAAANGPSRPPGSAHPEGARPKSGGASSAVSSGTARLDEPVHALRWAGPAVWTASGCILARWTCTEGRWSKDWSCSVAQPVELMAPSPDGALLATAGRFD